MIVPPELLHCGDIIKEVNGIAVFVPEDMMIVLREAEESVTFKIVPTISDKVQSKPVSRSLWCTLSVLLVRWL